MTMAMTTFGRTIVVKGEVRADEPVTIEGRLEGSVTSERDSVILAASCDVRADIIANNITVFGRVTGKLIAADYVDLRADAIASGQVVSKRFILDDGAAFQGRVEPQHLEAALRVARFQQKKRDAS